MNRGELERRVHDYLDGRLSETERAEMERHIDNDPELARRVETAREIGRALREDPAELSPDFYVRARTRFEETRGRRERPWFALVSWETAGLAAAAMLALVIFLPGVFRDSVPQMPELSGTTFDKTRATADPPADRPTAATEELAAAAPPAEDSRGEVGPRKKTAPAPSRSALPGSGPTRADRLEAQKPPAGRLQAALEQDEDAMGQDDATGQDDAMEQEAASASEGLAAGDAFAAEPRSTPATARPAAPPAAVGQAKSEARSEPEAEASTRMRETEARRGRLESRASLSDRAMKDAAGVAVGLAGDLSKNTVGGESIAVGLPAGIVPANSVRIVTSRAEWLQLLDGPAGPALASLGAPDGRRLVLVGPRDVPVDCAGATLTRAGAAYRVRLRAPAPGVPTGLGGCALALPDDGLPIEIADAEPNTP